MADTVAGGCLPKYMALTLLPKDNTVPALGNTATVSIEVGAYKWGAYDWTLPAQPTLASAVDTGAFKLAAFTVSAGVLLGSIY
jgi:hypothetical protein